ncbi:alpha/beta fold hydrolase [Plantactinospora soyae]|uniref:Acyl-CoA synthetase (AMP-forming)/AMP-acid ligase II/pimeloyl-ACP methyl ester carboxylesterase n=1 Tax=Plantactinospora soyae TaxID=1544732 RepID=A0A927MB38_9ACTN|nr:alpha/beta fold hydrolase [Plantactinospora soyae]MBE1491493.1 acyl-CoA synthetase (AMP-forming)/AMP-acid ligase II/pimeloyl-ACP methyl ester carboxylesterase [Plantactinospora soyae]
MSGDESLLPAELPGLDPAWSRRVTAVDSQGVERTWHVLDTAVTDPERPSGYVGTLLCVHGNPTWSYLWRHLLARFSRPDAPPWRVVAVDHLDMGFSERTGTVRPLAQRIDDLGTVTDALGLTGPVITVGHDWGGVISLGWALRHPDQLRGVVLTNTAVHQPPGSSAPTLIRLARLPGILPAVTVSSPTFLRATLALANPPLPEQVRAGYLAPYRTPDRRAAIGGFVADIPLTPEHPSWPALTEVAQGLSRLAEVPTLLLWGPRDPVFGAVHLRDLRTRLPHAKLHRFEGAGHLLAEDADVPGAVVRWLADLDRPAPKLTPSPSPSPEPTEPWRPLWAALADRSDDRSVALVELAHGGRQVSWALLWRRIREIAAGLAASGVRRGDRVALLVPPGADLTAAVYACLRIGAVIVVADPGLGLAGMNRALRAADPAHLIAVGRGLAVARALRWPGRRFGAGPGAAVLGASTLGRLARIGAGHPELPSAPGPDDDAAVLFTSGSTGPAKGAVYTHRQLAAMRDALSSFGLDSDTGIVAAFAPFALFGPALGATSVIPDMKVTAPRTLTAAALAEATAAIDASAVFAAPAALRNVVETGDALDDRQRAALEGVELLLSAGAPVPAVLLAQARALMPKAQPHTPYGMTEVLPVTDVTLDEIVDAGSGDGVCVGRPIPGVKVAIAALDPTGTPAEQPGAAAGVTGEIMVRAGHVKDRYDALWLTERVSSRNPGWHRTGDVGYLDPDGRLWVQGRLAHVLSTSDGVLTPVGIEQRVESLPQVARAAAVGVGPRGVTQLVVVAETRPPVRRAGPADRKLADDVREVTGLPVAAVLVVPDLPTDIRHNSKIDRTRLGRWAERVLAGGGLGKL